MLNQAKEISMRHEEKYICSESYLRVLESRLKGFLNVDSNQNAESYMVRSLYLDTVSNAFYEEGIDGVEFRKKYRIRIYNGDAEVIKLEKKTSIRNLKKKDTALLQKNQVEELLTNGILRTASNERIDSVTNEFILLQKTALLRPKLIVEYDRTAFVNDIGNIRITLDRNIRTTSRINDFFKTNAVYYPILPQGIHLLEVKWDGILPAYVPRLINFEALERTSFSKYCLSVDTIKNNGRAKEIYEF